MTTSMQSSGESVLLSEYVSVAASTDRFSDDEIKPILLGLFGEVGGVMATAKKARREREAYTGYQNAVEEEFGDAFWYLAALCRRLNLSVDDVLAAATSNGRYRTAIAASGLPSSPVSEVSFVMDVPALDEALVALGKAAADLLSIGDGATNTKERVVAFADKYLHALRAAGVNFATAINANMRKVTGRFLPAAPGSLPTFDDGFPNDERLPEDFEIVIRQRTSGKTYLQWNGVFIGDPLTDNIRDPDGYRFHDALHFANAAILHWSPTFRGLIKHKRKSQPRVEEAQDSGRAIVVEEGLSAFIFSRAKHLRLFEGQTRISFDLLKIVEQFVTGYEVSVCPLKLWEDCLLQGYDVFRQLRSANGGIVVGSRQNRRIAYKPLSGA